MTIPAWMHVALGSCIAFVGVLAVVTAFRHYHRAAFTRIVCGLAGVFMALFGATLAIAYLHS